MLLLNVIYCITCQRKEHNTVASACVFCSIYTTFAFTVKPNYIVINNNFSLYLVIFNENGFRNKKANLVHLQEMMLNICMGLHGDLNVSSNYMKIKWNIEKLKSWSCKHFSIYSRRQITVHLSDITLVFLKSPFVTQWLSMTSFLSVLLKSIQKTKAMFCIN